MYTTHKFLLAAALVGFAAVTASRADTAQTERIARGKYLVENVGMCSDCHSPRNERGEFIQSLWLTGSPLPFKPTVEMPWQPASPPIAGLPTMTAEQAINFLQTGIRPNGTRPLPPMPPFRFSEQDATAVVAYLKSIGEPAAPATVAASRH